MKNLLFFVLGVYILLYLKENAPFYVIDFFMQQASLPSPKKIQEMFPLSLEDAAFIQQKRDEVYHILEGKDTRKLLIVGPCSIHDPKATLELAYKLKTLEKEISSHFLLIFRCFLEKPRTSLDWKGFLFNPHLSKKETPETLIHGMYETGSLLKKLVSLKMPLATECLQPLLASYFKDFFTWGCIGARTSFSQPHRELASFLPFPIGFKNSLDGSLEGALHGIESSSQPQIYLGIEDSGLACATQTAGNPYSHLILRGTTSQENFNPLAFQEAQSLLIKKKLNTSILIDCAHGNSQKNLITQKENFLFLIHNLSQYTHLKGFLLECNLKEGSQPLNSEFLSYGISITDPCLSFEDLYKTVLTSLNLLKAPSLCN